MSNQSLFVLLALLFCFVDTGRAQTYTGEAIFRNGAWIFPTISDSLEPGVFVPGNLVELTLQASAAKNAGVFEYQYSVTVLPTSPKPLYEIAIPSSERPISIEVNNWYGRYAKPRGVVAWAAVAGNMVNPGETKSDFSYRSEMLPSRCELLVQNETSSGWSTFDGPAEIDDLFFSIRDTSMYSVVASVCSKSLPTPLIGSAFADTIASYNTQAYSLGWTSDENVYAEIENYLHEGRDFLLAGDSLAAARVLSLALMKTEAENEITLSSESYALLKYNLEYLLGLLPDPGTTPPSLPAAITVRANVLEDRVEPRFDGNSFLVDGNNYLLDGSETDGDVVGIVTDRLDSYDAIVVAVGGNQSDNIIGSSGFTSVEQQAIDVGIESLIDFSLSQSGVVEISGVVVGESYGSESAPVVVHASSDLTLDDATGYGLLIVDGELTVTGTSSWTGLVISRGAEESTAGFVIQGEASVLGAVVINESTNAAAKLFVRGSAVVRYSSEAVEVMVRGALSN